MKRECWEGTWPAVTRSGYCCYSYYYYSFLLTCPQEGRQVGAQACPRVHQNPASRTAEPAKQTCRPSAGRREQGEGVLAQGWAGIPEGAAQGGVAPRRWRHLGFPWLFLRSWEWPLPSPRSRWPLQPGTCSRGRLPGRCKPGIARVSSESSHEACWLPGGARLGLSWWRRSERGLSLVPEPPPHPPGESQESRDHRELCVLGPCLGGWGGGHGVKGRVKQARVQVKRLIFVPTGQQASRVDLTLHFIKRGRK